MVRFPVKDGCNRGWYCHPENKTNEQCCPNGWTACSGRGCCAPGWFCSEGVCKTFRTGPPPDVPDPEPEPSRPTIAPPPIPTTIKAPPPPPATTSRAPSRPPSPPLPPATSPEVTSEQTENSSTEAPEPEPTTLAPAPLPSSTTSTEVRRTHGPHELKHDPERPDWRWSPSEHTTKHRYKRNTAEDPRAACGSNVVSDLGCLASVLLVALWYP